MVTITDEELDRVMRQAREVDSQHSPGAALRGTLHDHGIKLIDAGELERLKRADQSYGEALHTPRSRGGLSNT